MNGAIPQLRRDLAYADVNAAIGRLFVSIGEDPMPERIASHDLATLAAAARQVEEGWFQLAGQQAQTAQGARSAAIRRR